MAMAPAKKRGRPHYISSLTAEERAQMGAHADRWVDIGLRTGPSTPDQRARFEAAARKCYEAAGIEWPGVVVWVPSPLVLAFAAPAAAFAIQQLRRRDAVDGAVVGAVDGAVRGAVDGAVVGAVGDAVRDAVRGAVDGAVGGAVGGAVVGAVGGAVGDAVRDAVRGAVDGAVVGAVGGAVVGAVDGAVRDAVRGAVDGAVDGAVGDAVDGGEIERGGMDTISRAWSYCLGGQFWVGFGWYWGNACTSFFRDVVGLQLDNPDLWERSRAYDETAETACWWYPHRDFVMVSEHPSAIHRELVDPSRPRGWGSHRLHRDDGPAIVWPDGWGLWCIHGVRVPQQVVEAPETLTPQQIRDERNAEVRRIMIDRYGAGRYLEDIGATVLDEVAEDVVEVAQGHDGLPVPMGLRGARLYRAELAGDEPLVMVSLLNSTPEPDGSVKRYHIRVPPDVRTAREAVAWSFGVESDTYLPAVET